MKRTISILLLMSMLLSCAACGSDEAVGGDTTVGDTAPAVTTEADPYNYPNLNLDENEFTFLTPSANWWGMHVTMDYEDQTGESLDDAIYKRNIAIEDRYNVVICEAPVAATSDAYYGIQETLRTDIMSGDSAYDAAFVCGDRVGTLMVDNSLMNLRELAGLNLDEAWWNQATVQASTFGNDQLYFAQGDLSLSAFDLTFMLMFNEVRMNELGLEKPYNLVREGKWTIDRLWEYCKANANLNGDSSFALTETGKSTYGYTTYNLGALAGLIGAGVQFTKNDNSGTPVLNLDNERFYNVCDKLASLYGSVGDFIMGTTDRLPSIKNYQQIYLVNRSLFLGCEVKATSLFRDVTDDFGVLPNPKLDETQDQYYSWTNKLAPVLVVPVTTKFPDEVGYILDTMSYMSHRDVLPVYYEVTLNQKGLRNEDSIEMMDYIRNSLYFDASLAYGWTTSLSENIRDFIFSGNGSVASVVASGKNAVEANIAKMMEQFSS